MAWPAGNTGRWSSCWGSARRAARHLITSTSSPPRGLARDARGRASAGAAVRAAQGVRAEGVVYVASFENHPRAVRALAAGRALWGNPPEVLERVRDPLLVAATLARHGLATPAVRAAAPRSGGGCAWPAPRRPRFGEPRAAPPGARRG